MHHLFQAADALSREVIGAAIEVHRVMGPGLIESIYEKCLIRELEIRRVAVSRQQAVRIDYKDFIFEEALRFNLLAGGCLLLELKAVETVLPIHKAQLLSYIKLLDVPIGLLINFHSARLTDEIHRMLLKGADQ